MNEWEKLSTIKNVFSRTRKSNPVFFDDMYSLQFAKITTPGRLIERVRKKLSLFSPEL